MWYKVWPEINNSMSVCVKTIINQRCLRINSILPVVSPQGASYVVLSERTNRLSLEAVRRSTWVWGKLFQDGSQR